MKKIFIYFTLIILTFLFGLLIGKIFVPSISKLPTNTEVNENTLKMDTFIPDDTAKIKVSKFNNSNELPFVCYISDKKQIQNFVNSFSNVELSEYTIDDDISPLYIIDFIGDSNTTIKISSNRILQLSTVSSFSIFKLSDEDFSTIENLTNIKYSLHDCDLEKPLQSTAYDAQQVILSELSDSERANLKTEIHNIHSLLEFYLVDHVNILKDSNSIYWEPATIDEIFTQPNGVKFQSYGFWEYRDSLQNILSSDISDTTREIINDILYHLQYGMDDHDLSECFEVHKIIHDLDYWIINYPISSFTIAPADWGGVDCYYGLIEKYNL